MHFPLFSPKALRLRLRSKSHRLSSTSNVRPPTPSTAFHTSLIKPDTRPPTPDDDTTQPQTVTLPYEVLQVIFAMAMQPSSSDIDFVEKSDLRANILAFSQVCGQWRYAAQGHSILWVHAIDFARSPPEAIAYYLRLSRPRAVNVGHRSAPMRVSGKRGVAGLESLKEDCSRVREWNIDLARDFQCMNLQHLFGHPNDDTPPFPAHTLRHTGLINLPGDSWNRLLCSLEKLSLRDTNLVLTPSMALSNLTELSIVSPRFGGAKLYRIMEIVALLRWTPCLQFLNVKDAIAADYRDNLVVVGQAVASVNLPRLRVISMSESSWEAFYLLLQMLPILRRPPQCALTLALSPSFESSNTGWVHPQETGDALRTVRRTIRDSWSSQAIITPRVEIAFQRRIGRRPQFIMGTIADPEETLDWNGTGGSVAVHRYLDDYFKPSSSHPLISMHPPVSIAFNDLVREDTLRTACILNAHALSTTQSVRITMNVLKTWPRHAESATRLIPMALSRARRVTSMTLDEEASMMVLNSLQDKAHMDSGQGPWPVPYLPNLKFIAIESTRAVVGEKGYFGDEMKDQTMLVVKEYVEWRERVRYPVKVLWSGSVSGGEEEVGGNMRREAKRNGMVSIPVSKPS